MKTVYKIEWERPADKDGNRIHDYTTIRRDSLLKAIQDVCDFFEIKETDIFRTEKLYVTE